jgi:hypothetical protein
MVLTRNGVPVDNPLKYDGNTALDKFFGMCYTQFYFTFEHEIREPGIYSLTGKYKGVPFESQKMITEQYPIGDDPANPDDLYASGWCLEVSETEVRKTLNVDSLLFAFNGFQQMFYMSDLTDLKLTLDGEEIEFSIRNEIPLRNVWANHVGDGVYTEFIMSLTKKLTAPGEYQLTGNYMGKPFVSDACVVNG